jgi:signal peptidase I
VCEVEVLAGDGQFACRLSDGLGTAEAVFPIGKPGNGIALQADGNETPHRAAGQMLEVGQTYRIEFAFVDRRASLTIDGREVVKPIDRPGDADTLARRGQVSRPLQFGIKGASVVVRKLVLYRDVYYRPEGTNGISAPHQLAADEYYVLGDNSGNSHDSREWALPGVPERDFLGKPFLIHQPLKVGRVGVNGAERLYQTVDWARLRWVR